MTDTKALIAEARTLAKLNPFLWKRADAFADALEAQAAEIARLERENTDMRAALIGSTWANHGPASGVYGWACQVAEGSEAMRTIKLEIDCGPKTCDRCEFLQRFSTGLVGEWHMHCILFAQVGEWRNENMKRAPGCLLAEKASK